MAKKVQDEIQAAAKANASTIDANKQVLMDAFNAQRATTDPTQQPQAATQADVEGQDARTRLWQSLNTTYGLQREQSDKNYDQAIANADRQLLSRGMQRSSYGAQTLANMQQEKIKANTGIMSNQIADYQNRLSALEQQEQQFAYQKERDQIADQQWKQQFDAQQDQWKQQFEYQKMSTQQQVAYNYLMNMLESGDNPSDALLKQAGITRADYQQMKATPVMKARAGGGRSGGPGPGNNLDPNDTNNDAWSKLLAGLQMYDMAPTIGSNAAAGAMVGGATSAKAVQDKRQAAINEANKRKQKVQQGKTKDRT